MNTEIDLDNLTDEDIDAAYLEVIAGAAQAAADGNTWAVTFLRYNNVVRERFGELDDQVNALQTILKVLIARSGPIHVTFEEFEEHFEAELAVAPSDDDTAVTYTLA